MLLPLPVTPRMIGFDARIARIEMGSALACHARGSHGAPSQGCRLALEVDTIDLSGVQIPVCVGSAVDVGRAVPADGQALGAVARIACERNSPLDLFSGL